MSSFARTDSGMVSGERSNFGPQWTALDAMSSNWTLLNHRHEIGVVEHAEGDRYAVAALTASRVSAGVQHDAEATMARVARRLRDHLRH